MNNFEYKVEDNNLIIKLSGHIDSFNSVEIDKALMESFETNEWNYDSIIIDCDDLQYISSAGLRIILKLKKKVSDVKLINVHPEVYDILDVTGFTDMMDVRKAFHVIDIEGYELIGKGANGSVYRMSPDMIVKVYHNPDSLADIDKERELARAAFVHGLPTAIPFETVKIASGGYGSIFEMLNATNCAKAIIRGEKTTDEVADIMATLLKQIHETVIKSDLVPNMKEVALDWVEFLKDYLTAEEYEKLKRMVSEIEENEHLIHGDFHMRNVMLQNGEVMMIDMDTLSHGDPIFELACIFNAYIGFPSVGVSDTMTFFGLPEDVCEEVYDKFLHKFLEGKSDEEINAISEKASIIGYARIMRRAIRRNALETEEGRAVVDKCHQHISELLAKYDDLKLQ